MAEWDLAKCRIVSAERGWPGRSLPGQSARVALRSSLSSWQRPYAFGAHPASASDQAIWPCLGSTVQGFSSSRWPLRGYADRLRTGRLKHVPCLLDYLAVRGL